MRQGSEGPRRACRWYRQHLVLHNGKRSRGRSRSEICHTRIQRHCEQDGILAPFRPIQWVGRAVGRVRLKNQVVVPVLSAGLRTREFILCGDTTR